MKKYYINAGALSYKATLTIGMGKYFQLTGDTIEETVNNSVQDMAKSLFRRDHVLEVGKPWIETKTETVSEYSNCEWKKMEKKRYFAYFKVKACTPWEKGSPNYKEYEQTYNCEIYELDE